MRNAVAETWLPHRASGAYGGAPSLELLALPFEVRRWEEDDGLRATTCSANLPVFLNTLCAHRHTPFRAGPYSRSYPQGKTCSGREGLRWPLTRSAGLCMSPNGRPRPRMTPARGRGNATAVNGTCGRESHSPDGHAPDSPRSTFLGLDLQHQALDGDPRTGSCLRIRWRLVRAPRSVTERDNAVRRNVGAGRAHLADHPVDRWWAWRTGCAPSSASPPPWRASSPPA